MVISTRTVSILPEKEYVESHKRVKKKIEEKGTQSKRPCVSVGDIAEELGMDIRTLRAHLELMEIDEYGTYLDDKERYFCPMERIEEIAERLKKKIREKREKKGIRLLE